MIIDSLPRVTPVEPPRQAKSVQSVTSGLKAESFQRFTIYAPKSRQNSIHLNLHNPSKATSLPLATSRKSPCTTRCTLVVSSKQIQRLPFPHRDFFYSFLIWPAFRNHTIPIPGIRQDVRIPSCDFARSRSCRACVSGW